MNTSVSTPTRIGAYEVVNVIGRGGMGTVYKATDPRIGRSVAIKVLTAAGEDPDLLVRFYREAKYTGSLQHQNIVTVYELGHQDGFPYLVMEYLEGVSLDNLIASGRPMAMAEKLRIILQVCSGLAYAHKRDLVHRDIKPANIVIVENGTAKIVDFGIARLGGNRLTKTGHIVGSLNYMSPEQLNGNVELDLRTDLYSTGVVLFQLLTGVLPFDADSTAATLRKIVQEPPPPLTAYMKDCPAELEAITQKALAKNREERYSSAEEFAVDIARVQQQYERQMLEDNLKQAAESLQRGDFAGARQQVLQVLRVAPQNVDASDLLRSIKQGQEQQQREQQALRLQMKAEEAFRKNDFASALQSIEQGLQIDSSARPSFLALRDAIFEAQKRMANYREALERAQAAVRSGDLEAAKKALDDAAEVMPGEPECKRLAAQISARIEQRQREQKASQQRDFALKVNAVEKAMSDARMLVYLGQVPEALQALDKVGREVGQLPAQWRDQVEALRREALAKHQELRREQAGQVAAPPESPEQSQGFENWNESRHRTGQRPALFDATSMMGQQTATPEFEASLDGSSQGTSPQTATRFGEIGQRTTGSHDIDAHAHFAEERSEVAPELLEFLQPEKTRWTARPMMWLGVAVAILVAVAIWLNVRAKPANQADVKPGLSNAVAGYSYAEINAEPWARIADIAPVKGEAESALGAATPLLVKLPAGDYTVTLEGPNHEQKQVRISVPQQGGAKCFAVFRKPDVNQILSQ